MSYKWCSCCGSTVTLLSLDYFTCLLSELGSPMKQIVPFRQSLAQNEPDFTIKFDSTRKAHHCYFGCTTTNRHCKCNTYKHLYIIIRLKQKCLYWLLKYKSQVYGLIKCSLHKNKSQFVEDFQKRNKLSCQAKKSNSLCDSAKVAC